jgi:hypothetical protein
MTKEKFSQLCSENLVSPEIALENDDLRNALQTRNDERVEKIFKEEF